MKALILIQADGSSMVGPVVPIKFDAKKWADERFESLAMLGVISIKEMVLSTEVES